MTECDRCRGVNTEHACPRCGATTPHQTFAELVAVNIEQQSRLDNWRGEILRQVQIIQEQAKELTRLRDELEERNASFNLQWKATQRAIKRWQQSHPGNDLVWPDKADLLVWLLEEDARLRAALAVFADGTNWADSTDDECRNCGVEQPAEFTDWIWNLKDHNPQAFAAAALEGRDK